MNSNQESRRSFIKKTSAGALAYMAAYSFPTFARTTNDPNKLAVLGGTPVRAGKTWPQWPFRNQQMVDNLTKTIQSGIWSRIDAAETNTLQFEQDFAKLAGSTWSVATGSGTQSLSTSLFALGIQPGDEVITSPYTDMGTVSAILTCHALPVFADLNPLSYQMDADDIEHRITPRTKAIIAVHMLGAPCEIDKIMSIAKKYKLHVVEDAAQAHLVQFNGIKVGNFGELGCFSFQASKQISCGEGGAVVGNDEQLHEWVYAVMNHGTARKEHLKPDGSPWGYHINIGPKYRMNEFQAGILKAQQDTIVDRFRKRDENGKYLRKELESFNGLTVQQHYPGTDNAGYYLFGMSYHAEEFSGASRGQFLKAMVAEGVGLSGYITQGLHHDPWVDYMLSLPSYRKNYGQKRLKQWKDSLHLPKCDQACGHMAGLYSVGTLLGDRSDMDSILAAIHKVHKNKDAVAAL